MVSWQVDDEGGANVLSVRIWVKSAVLEYEPRCSAKKTGKFWLRTGTQGGGADADTKENPALESVWRRRLRGADSKKGVDVLAEGGGGGDNTEETGRSFRYLGPILTQVDSHLQWSQIGQNLKKRYVK